MRNLCVCKADGDWFGRGVLGGTDYQEPLDYLQRMMQRGGDGSQGEMGYDAEIDPREAAKRVRQESKL